MRCFLGIDGGGTKTKALLCDENLETVAVYTGAGINFNAIGMEKARENLKAVYDGVTSGQDISLLSVCIGSAALEDRADGALVREFCGGVIGCGDIILDSDLFICLEAMDTGGPAAVAVCGTGSMAAGRDGSGRIVHTGGWGYLLGDEGSGYSFGKDSVKEALRNAEAHKEPTTLTRAVMEHFGVSSADELIGAVYREGAATGRVAAFAPEFFRLVKSGDPDALRIMDKNAEAFSKTVLTLLAGLPDITPLGLWGGIFLNSPEFADMFSGRIKKARPATDIAPLPHPPEYGAVLAAKRSYRRKT